MSPNFVPLLFFVIFVMSCVQVRIKLQQQLAELRPCNTLHGLDHQHCGVTYPKVGHVEETTAQSNELHAYICTFTGMCKRKPGILTKVTSEGCEHQMNYVLYVHVLSHPTTQQLV